MILSMSCGGAVARKADACASFLDAQSFDYRDFLRNFGDRLRSFVAVQLRGGKAQRLREGDNGLRRPVYENAHKRDEWRQFAKDVARSERRDRARALRIKVQADGVGAKFRGETRVLRRGDATNFHTDHRSSLRETGRGVTEDRACVAMVDEGTRKQVPRCARDDKWTKGID